ncbi:MAG: peptidoglycan DD-metalloendopeptidase family protein [Thermoanaerobaculia bacterium]|nr:peptidoglycan DD-metalloendopeptidase family protein [Thermoanaerobaculia bacterium]
MKQHTIIFVPHARAQFRKWRVTSLQALLLLGGIAFLTLGGVTASWLYFTSSFDRDQLQQIEQENQELKAVNQRFESNIRNLEGKLSDYQDRIQKLALVAGLSELAPETEPGIGGLAPSGRTELENELADLRRRADGLDGIVSRVAGQLDESRLRMSHTPTITPVRGILTSGFGYRKDPFTGKRAFHPAIDISAPYGKEIVAPGDGIVTKAGRASGYGRVIYLSHGYGITTRYGHMSKLAVEAGQTVKRGDVIGYLGSSGRSTGNHLHYEVRVDGTPQNPLGYMLDDRGR